MTARILPFPNFFRPATPRDEMGVIIIFPIVRIERECPKIALLRRQSKPIAGTFQTGIVRG